jgi:NADPH:quinone reductase-like Zn-dependent oxidoreductase
VRAGVVEELGSPPRPGDHADPSRGDGEALLEVVATPLNPIEIRVSSGRFARRAQPPYVPGVEGVGRVLESAALAPGTRVRFEGDLPGFGRDGALAERATAPEDALVELPDEVDDATAAALGVVGITAAMALDRARLREGERVLVLGATGAVGQAAVQLAKARGAARVVAAGRDPDALARGEELGADASVSLAEGAAASGAAASGGTASDAAASAPDRTSLAAAFRDAAGGPLDVVVDPLWGEPAMAALAVLADGGRLVNVGEAAGHGVDVPLGAIRPRQGTIHTLSSGWMPVEEKVAVYRSLLGDVAAGRLVVDHEVVPLDEVGSAWERQAGSPNRKLVIRI